MRDSPDEDWVPFWPRLCAIVSGFSSLVALSVALPLRDELGNWPLLVPLCLAGIGIALYRASRAAGILAIGYAGVLLCSTVWISVAPPKGPNLEATHYFIELFRTPFGWLAVIAVATLYSVGACSIFLNWRNLRWI
jgi:hypothetical protein